MNNLYRHKRSGDLYRKLADSFSVERQRSSVIYIGLARGEVFDRDADRFNENFEYVCDPQAGIKPNLPKAPE